MQEIQQTKTPQLRALVAELQESIRKHRFGVATQQETNVHARRTMRREVARIMTELHKRQENEKSITA